jgi:hypothetical protein
MIRLYKTVARVIHQREQARNDEHKVFRATPCAFLLDRILIEHSINARLSLVARSVKFVCLQTSSRKESYGCVSALQIRRASSPQLRKQHQKKYENRDLSRKNIKGMPEKQRDIRSSGMLRCVDW